MEHDISTLRLIIRNTEQRSITTRAVVALESGLKFTPAFLHRTPFPVDGDTLTHLRGLNQAERHGYYLAATDAHGALYPLREALRDNDEAVA